MAGLLTPLQLTAASALLNNQGIKPLPAALTSALAAFNSTTVMANFFAAVSYYKAQSFFSESVLDSLLSIGSSVCPALGNSIPTAPLGTFTNLINEYLTINTVTDLSTLDPSGFSLLIEQTGAAYLGDGDIGRFAQGFMAVQGYINSTNVYINSSVNVQNYLGPTFTDMDALVTNQISNINSNFAGFGIDLDNQGQLFSMSDLDNYGTPGGLLAQFARVANIQGGLPGFIQDPLIAAGLSTTNISQLLAGQGDLSDNEYNKLQRLAYSAMTKITGSDLDQVLAILDVTTPGVNTMADLLNPVITYPNSYSTMNTLTPEGVVPIYNPGTASVNMNIAPGIDAFLPTVTGCDELGKVMPPDQAVANRGIQLSLQQITGAPSSTPADLAEAIIGQSNTPWNLARSYLANDLVFNGEPVPTYYRAQQTVPVGTDINDTNYWLPTTLGGLNTMADLPLIEAQTAPITADVANYYNSLATGSGPNGTITTYDVIGLAIDSNDFAARLNTATTAIDALQTAGSLATLNTAYVNLASASNNTQMATYIADANNAISALSASPYVTTLNTAWVYMANILNLEKGYQTAGSIDYFVLIAGDKLSTQSFVQQLPLYGNQVDAGGPAEFLTQVADTAIIGGQAIVGCLREGQNQTRLSQARIGQNYTPSTEPEVTPVPAVTPVY